MHQEVRIPHLTYARNISHHCTESFLIHAHAEYELYYYLSGSASFLVGGAEYTLEPQTMLLFPPNLFHGVRVTSDEAYVRRTVHFTMDCVQPERRAALARLLPRAEKTGGNPCLKKNMAGTALLPLLDHMEACAQHDQPTRERLIPILLEAMIAAIALSSPPAETDALPEVAQVNPAQGSIIAYLNQHFTEPISLDHLAERLFISKHHLNRSFREATGFTVHDYLISKRVSYVQQLLMNGIPATQAASLAGFGDYTSFYRAYLKRFGHAPSRDLAPTRTTMADVNKILQEQVVITPDIYRTKLEERD